MGLTLQGRGPTANLSEFHGLLGNDDAVLG